MSENNIYTIDDSYGQTIYVTTDLGYAFEATEELNRHLGEDCYRVRGDQYGDYWKSRLEKELAQAKRNRYWTVQLNWHGKVIRCQSKAAPNIYCKINKDRFGYMYAYMEAKDRNEAIARAIYMYAHFWDKIKKEKGIDQYGVEYDQDTLNKIHAIEEE